MSLCSRRGYLRPVEKVQVALGLPGVDGAAPAWRWQKKGPTTRRATVNTSAARLTRSAGSSAPRSQLLLPPAPARSGIHGYPPGELLMHVLEPFRAGNLAGRGEARRPGALPSAPPLFVLRTPRHGGAAEGGTDQGQKTAVALRGAARGRQAAPFA